MKPTPHEENSALCLPAISMPRLDDDAVIQIHDFIHHVLDLFEARYGDQIHRFYEDQCGDCSIDPDRGLNLDDPPF